MASSHPLSPLAKFQLVWRILCEALLSSSLVRQKHPYLLSRLCLVYVGDTETPVSGVSSMVYVGDTNVVLKIKSAIVFADRQRRSQFEHDDRRRADRAPQITASFT